MVDKIMASEIVGKTIISEDSGRKLGSVSNLDFVIESGELLNIIVDNPSRHLEEMNLKTDEKGRILIPFTAVKSISDFVIISETEL